MRSERIEHVQQCHDGIERARIGILQRAAADHHLRDRGVETERLDIFADFFDRRVDDLAHRLCPSAVLDLCVTGPLAGLILVHDQPPDARQKREHAFDALVLHGFVALERPHEHLVKPQRSPRRIRR